MTVCQLETIMETVLAARCVCWGVSVGGVSVGVCRVWVCAMCLHMDYHVNCNDILRYCVFQEALFFNHGGYIDLVQTITL